MSSDPTPIARHRLWLTAVLAAAVLSACAWPRASVAPEAAPSPAWTGLANPAAVACVQAGGRLQIERSADGERGICLLPGGLRCDEWAWFRKEAGACCTTGAPLAGSEIQACR
jgi:putative hemolysin